MLSMLPDRVLDYTLVPERLDTLSFGHVSCHVNSRTQVTKARPCTNHNSLLSFFPGNSRLAARSREIEMDGAKRNLAAAALALALPGGQRSKSTRRARTRNSK